MDNFNEQAGVTDAPYISYQIKMTSDSGTTVTYQQLPNTVDSMPPGSICYETKDNFGP